MNETTKRLFHKLVELNKRAPDLLATVKRLASDGEAFAAAMSAVEQKVKALRAAEEAAAAGGAAANTPAAALPAVQLPAGAQPPPASPVAALSAEEWEMLCREIERSAPLCVMFGSDDGRFSGADPREVATLAELADVAPDRGGELYTEDAAFMSVLELMHSERIESAGQLLVNTVATLITLIYSQRDVAFKLYGVATTPHWREVLKLLEAGRRVEADGENKAAVALYEEIVGLLPPESRQTLFRDAYLARLTPPALFRLAWDSQAAFDEALKTLAPELESSSGRRSYQASAALETLRGEKAAGEILAGFEAEMGLRLEVATHLLDLRQAVKRDALVHVWPEAALLAMSNFESLKEIESLVFGHIRDALPPQPSTFMHEESYDLYELCKADERLVSYLRLLPRFSEMDIADFAGGAAAAALLREASRRGVASRPSPQTPGDAAPSAVTKAEKVEKVEKADKVEMPSDLPPDTRPEKPVHAPSERVNATIHVLFPIGHDEHEGEPPAYDFGLSRNNYDPELFELDLQLGQLTMEILSALKLPLEGETHRYVAEIFRRPDSIRRVTVAGKRLFEWLEVKMNQLSVEQSLALKEFQQEKFILPVWRGVRESLAQGVDDARLTINTNILRVAALPWEWLMLPEQEVSFTLNPGCSLVRSSQGSPEVLGLYTPLRVMGLAAGPNAQAHGLAVKRMMSLFKNLSKNNILELSLIDKPISASAFESELRAFAPQVLYLDTHVLLLEDKAPPETPSPSLPNPPPARPIPSLSLGPDESISTSALSEIIRDAEVQLVVFGDNPSGAFGPNALLDCVIELMKAGLPAALAPTRFVEEGTSVNFLRNFFGAWLTSQTLEASVASAREALRNGRGDWSVYALFAGPEALQKLRL